MTTQRFRGVVFRAAVREALAAALVLLAGLQFVACAAAPLTGPRELQEEELAALEVEGGVAKWLPIRFSATVTNALADLALTELTFEIGGKTVSRATHISPGETQRLRMQWLFPEDEQFGEIDDPEAVPWRLVAGLGEPTAR